MSDRVLPNLEEQRLFVDKALLSFTEISRAVAMIENNSVDFDEFDMDNVLMQLNTLSYDLGFSFYLKEMGSYDGDIYFVSSLRIKIDDLDLFTTIVNYVQAELSEGHPAVLDDIKDFLVVLFNSQFGSLKEYCLIEENDKKFEPFGPVLFEQSFVQFWNSIPLYWLERLQCSESFVRDVTFLKAILKAPFSQEEIEEILYYFGWLMVSLNLDLSLLQQGKCEIDFVSVVKKNIEKFMEHLDFAQNNPGISALRREFSARLMSILDDFDLAVVYTAANEVQAKWLLDFSTKLKEKYKLLAYFN